MLSVSRIEDAICGFLEDDCDAMRRVAVVCLDVFKFRAGLQGQEEQEGAEAGKVNGNNHKKRFPVITPSG